MENQQRQYQPYGLSATGFNPQQVSSSTKNLERQYAKDERAEQKRYNAMVKNQEVELANLNVKANAEQKAIEARGKQLQEIGAFSKSLFDIGTTILKESKEQRLIDETFEGMFGAPEPITKKEVEEDVVLAEIDRENASAAKETELITGSAAAGELVATESPSGQAIQPYRVERANITQAQVGYLPYMTSYLQGDSKMMVGSDSISVREAYNSGDSGLISAAIASGRTQFFKDYGLGNYSKRRVVNTLKGTVLNTDSQLVTGGVNAGIKRQRDTAKKGVENLSYEVGSSVELENIDASFQSLAATAWATRAYDTRAEANKAVVDSMLTGMEARGDVAAIEELERTQKVPGMKGSELRTIDPKRFDEAKANAAKNEESRVAEIQTDIRSNMFQELRGATNQEERDVIIEDAANQLEAIGDYEGARNLRKDRDDLVTSGRSDYNGAQLIEAAKNGEIGLGYIDEQEALGNVTSTDANAAREAISVSSGLEKPKNKAAADIVDNFFDKTENDLLVAFGLSKDATGRIITIGSEGGAIVDEGTAEIIIGQAQRDLNLIANRLLLAEPAIANNPRLLQIRMMEELNRWQKDNLYTVGGKFYIGDITKEEGELDDEFIKRNEAAAKRFETLAASPTMMATPNLTNPRLNNTARNFVNKGVSREGNVSQDVKRYFNPLRGDKLLPKSDVQQMVIDYGKGKIGPQLQGAADGVGMTPLALLQQQSAAYGLPIVRPREMFSSRAGTSPTAYEGAQSLMQMGLPSRGAAWLAASIEHESGWSGQRPQWDLGWDGAGTNGGLLSWNRGRLAKLEARYGRKTTKISTTEQLDFLMDELRLYPEARRIFMNPYSTERQLIRASKIYIGYNDTDISQEGRYQTARALVNKLED